MHLHRKVSLEGWVTGVRGPSFEVRKGAHLRMTVVRVDTQNRALIARAIVRDR
ncbi:hypothetical protein ACVIW2_003928 [Bradyrhizobium huanghuaihaiense]|uniref:Uncharacterized protein n=1 Tax=Bradyrhizobium huanghuaihaiense TaxID=990078 RepID=A0A562R457_9BRAD|nr:hypothetical protein IQ16_06149 [Bradyrhizobium huanghuaihaiense]